MSPTRDALWSVCVDIASSRIAPASTEVVRADLSEIAAYELALNMRHDSRFLRDDIVRIFMTTGDYLEVVWSR